MQGKKDGGLLNQDDEAQPMDMESPSEDWSFPQNEMEELAQMLQKEREQCQMLKDQLLASRKETIAAKRLVRNAAAAPKMMTASPKPKPKATSSGSVIVDMVAQALVANHRTSTQ